MVTYALDSSAILRFFDNESGSQRVEEIIHGHLQGNHTAAILAIHLGEVASKVCKFRGEEGWWMLRDRLAGLRLEIIPVTAERAVRTGIIKIRDKLPYVDAFGAEFAMESEDHIFVTADFDLKAVGHLARFEFLPRK